MTKNNEKNFLTIGVALFALALFWVFMPESKKEATIKLSSQNEEEVMEEEKELLPEEIGIITEGEHMGKEVDMSEVLLVEPVKEGNGPQVKVGDKVKVHYHGTLRDGTVFDSSVNRGEPFEFQVGVGQVIEGWDQTLPQMRVGEKVKATIPAKLAYGERAVGSIPANSTLIFEIELLEIVEE